MEGFVHDIIPFVHPNRYAAWSPRPPSDEEVWNEVYLNTINVYDLDYSTSKPIYRLCDPNDRRRVLPPHVVNSLGNSQQALQAPSSTQYMLPQQAQSLRSFEQYLEQLTGVRFHFEDFPQVIFHNQPEINPKNRGRG